MWAQQVESSQVAAPLDLKTAPSLDASAGPAPSVVGSPAPKASATHESLAWQRGRYHRMKVAGYMVAASALVLALGEIPMSKSRREHEADFGEGSCTPMTFPYVASGAFVAGMAVGLTGSHRDHELTSKHGSIVRKSGGWRAALAALGVSAALASLTAAFALSSICSS